MASVLKMRLSGDVIKALEGETIAGLHVNGHDVFFLQKQWNDNHALFYYRLLLKIYHFVLIYFPQRALSWIVLETHSPNPLCALVHTGLIWFEINSEHVVNKLIE